MCKNRIGIIAAAIVCMAALVAGCGGGGGGSVVTPTPTTTTAVATKLVMPGGGGGRLAGRAAGVTVTGARVVLKLADGRTFTMTDNGNGNYSADITNIGSSFIIEARKGDLLLENMFSDVTALVTGSSFDAGETNATTTAFVEIARSVIETMAAQMNVSGLNVDNNLDLLANLDNATLNVDVLQLRSDVVDGGDPTYTQVVTTVATTLAAADTTTTTPTGTDDMNNVLNELTASTTFTNQVTTVIQTVEIPRGDTDIDTIRTMINTMFSAWYGENSATLLSGMSDSFLDDGFSKTNALTAWQTEEWSKMSNCTFKIGGIDVELSTDQTTATASILEETSCIRMDDEQTTMSGMTTDEKGRMTFTLVNENGSWKWKGNQRKARADFKTVVSSASGTIYYYVSASVEETAAYPISAVTVSGPGIASSPLSLQKETGENNWLMDGHNWWIPVTSKPSAGDTYTFSITFTGDSAPTTYTETVTAAPRDSIFITLTNPTTGNLTSSGSTATLSWSDITASVAEIGALEIWFCGGNECSFRISRWGIPLTTTSISVPTTGLTAGDALSGQICYDDYDENETCSQLSLTYTGGN